MKMLTLARLHNELNLEWFKGSLSTPRFGMIRGDKWADYCSHTDTMRINRDLKLNKHGINTIIHELVHQFQYEILECECEHVGCFLSFTDFFKLQGIEL